MLFSHLCGTHARAQVTVHVIVPAAELAKDPLPGAVTLHTLREAIAAHKAGGIKLPEGSTRLAISIDGTETEQEIAMVKQVRDTSLLVGLAATVVRWTEGMV